MECRVEYRSDGWSAGVECRSIGMESRGGERLKLALLTLFSKPRPLSYLCCVLLPRETTSCLHDDADVGHFQVRPPMMMSLPLNEPDAKSQPSAQRQTSVATTSLQI